MAWGGYFYRDTSRFVGRALTTPGEVIENIVHHDNEDNSDTYSPVFRYTVDGQEITLESRVRTYPPAYDVGESIEVLYDPREPTSAKIVGFWSLWGAATAMGILGLLLSGISGWVLLRRRAAAAVQ
jgi:hypothetical protein